jgi:hypothetical protein
VFGGLAENEGGFLYGGSRFALLVKVVEDSTRVAALALFPFLLNGSRNGLASFEEIVDDPSSVPASAHFPLLNGGRNVDRFANFDGLGEGFISSDNEAGCASAQGSVLGTAAMTLHIDDIRACYGLNRCADHSTSNSFRASVRNPDGRAKNGGGAENQGDEEESRG